MNTDIAVAVISFITGVAVTIIGGILTRKNTQTQNQTQLDIARLNAEAAQFQAVLGSRTELIRDRVPLLREHRTQQVRPFREKAVLRAQLYYDLREALRNDNQAEIDNTIKQITTEAKTLSKEFSHLTVIEPNFLSAADALLKTEAAILGQFVEIANNPNNQNENQELTPDALEKVIKVFEEGYQQIIQYIAALNKAADDYIFSDDETERQLSELLLMEAETLQDSDSASVVDRINSKKFKPKLSVRLPRGWSAKETITVISPNGSANVIASSEPINKHMDLEKYVEQLGIFFQKEFKDYREIELKPAKVLNGRLGYIRHFEWIPDNGLSVTQIQHYCYEKDRVYTATATTRLTDKEMYMPKLQRLLERLSIE